MATFIIFLFRLLSSVEQAKLLHKLLTEVFPGKRLYKARPTGKRVAK
jgi:hypothetical protein